MSAAIRQGAHWTAALLLAAGSAWAGDTSVPAIPGPMDRFTHVPVIAERLRGLAKERAPMLPDGAVSTTVTAPSGTLSDQFTSPAVNGTVACLAYWNGSLVIGGQFTAVGARPVQGIARWDGATWQEMGALFPGVSALAVWKGDLIAANGGNIVRWTGSAWRTLIPELYGWVSAMTATDSALIIGGYLSSGNVVGPRIGRWNGTTFTWMGGELDAYPNAIVAFDGDWYAGGSPIAQGAQDQLVRFDGADWQPFGGLEQHDQYPSVLAMAVRGGELLVGGAFDTVATQPFGGLARWNGATWQTVPGVSAQNSTVFSMAVEGDSVVQIGGQWNGTIRLARWNGAVLTDEPNPGFPMELACDGARLAAAGPFDQVGDRITFQVTERGPNGWRPLEEWRVPMHGLAAYGPSEVRQFVAFDGGIVASGRFSAAANDTGWVRVTNVALWKDGEWHPMGWLTGYDDLVLLDGTLFAINSAVERWNGTIWEFMGGGPTQPTQGASAGGILYVGSPYYAGYSQGEVWRWDPLALDPTGWSALPRPAGIPDTAGVADMIGDGTSVVVSWQWPGHGQLTRWDGEAWSAISGVLSTPPTPLATWNGQFFAANMSADWSDSTLMVLEGGAWRSTGLNGFVRALTTLGPWLVAAGNFHAANIPGYLHIAAWDGTRWMPLPIEYSSIEAMLGDGHALWLGGYSLYNGPAGAVARWDWNGSVPLPVGNLFVPAIPTPFSTSVTLRFSLARLGTIRLAIYDLAGHEVTRLWNGVLGAGEHTLTWDGRDRRGNRAPSGVYFARLLLDDRTARSQRVVLIR